MSKWSPFNASSIGDQAMHGNPGKFTRGMKIASAAGIAFGLAAGGAVVAGAASGHDGDSHSREARGEHERGMPAAIGTVASVGANTFTLTTKGGTTKMVNVTSATTYRDRDVSSPSFATITVGKTVMVFGTSSSGVISATTVAVGMPGMGDGHAWSGASGTRTGHPDDFGPHEGFESSM